MRPTADQRVRLATSQESECELKDSTRTVSIPSMDEDALMSFLITGLAAAAFAPLFGLSDAELANQGVVRRLADRKPGFPCRVSLRDAEPGETLLLLNYEHLPVAGPYRSRYAIFVLEHAADACLEADEIPEVLSSRLLSVRAFDQASMLVDADVIQGTELRPVLNRMLSQTGTAYLHVHNAKPGCFAARVDRI